MTIYAILGMIAVWTVFTLGAAGFDHFAAKSANEEQKKLTAEISQLNETLAKQNQIKHQPLSLQEGIAEIQKLVDARCVKFDLNLSDFQSTGEHVPFLTRFAKNGNDPGWLQTPIQFQVKGSLVGVFELTKAISDSRVPIEFDGIEIQNSPSDRSDQSQRSSITAKVSFRILKQEAKA